MWIKPITDRTTGDTEYARNAAASEQDNLKGFLNVSDIIRIWENCNELARYFKISIQNLSWNTLLTNDLFSKTVQNVMTVTNACDRAYGTQFTERLQTQSETGIDFVAINTLEQALLDVYRVTIYQDEFRSYTGNDELYTGELGE